MLILAAKLLLAPACVVGASLVARRWGARAGGLVGGLPVVGGPILLVLVLVHGRVFGSGAAVGSLLGLVALTAFVGVYGRMSLFARPSAAVLAGWAAFLIVVVALAGVHPSRGVALAAAFASFVAGVAALPAIAPARGAEPPAPPRGDLPIRAGAALALVLVISAVSGSLGSHVSGLLAPFPIITAVLAVFTHRATGHEDVRALLRGFLVGFYGYAAFCFTVAVALPEWTTGAAFATAVGAALATQSAVVLALGRRAARTRRQGALTARPTTL